MDLSLLMISPSLVEHAQVSYYKRDRRTYTNYPMSFLQPFKVMIIIILVFMELKLWGTEYHNGVGGEGGLYKKNC